MNGGLVVVGSILGLLAFVLGFLAGNRYSVRAFRLEEADNTTRVVWLADWVRRRRRQLLLTGGHPAAIEQLAEIDRVAFRAVPPDPFEAFERRTP